MVQRCASRRISAGSLPKITLMGACSRVNVIFHMLPEIHPPLRVVHTFFTGSGASVRQCDRYSTRARSDLRSTFCTATLIYAIIVKNPFLLCLYLGNHNADVAGRQCKPFSCSSVNSCAGTGGSSSFSPVEIAN